MFVKGSHLSWFRVRLTAKELQELLNMYAFFIAAWESEDPHEQLLLEHAIQLYERLARMHRPEAKKYNIKFTVTDGLAFIQWWQMIDTSDQVHGNAIICRMVGEIDKDSKQVYHMKQLLQPQNTGA